MWQAGDDGRRALLKDEAPGAISGGVLQEYSNEFLRLRALAVTRLQALREGGTKSEEFKAAERALEEMESNRRLVQVQVRLELSGAAGTSRQEWDQRLQEWSREVAALRGQLDEMREETSRQKLRLPGAARSEGGFPMSAEQQGAARSTEMLERSSRQLEEARRVAVESEDVSQGVLSDLAAQRETIQHMRDSMQTVGAELSAARQALSRMLITAQRNRVMTLVIATILGIGLSVWALAILKLPLKWNLLLGVALFFCGAACFALRRHLRLRRG